AEFSHGTIVDARSVAGLFQQLVGDESLHQGQWTQSAGAIGGENEEGVGRDGGEALGDVAAGGAGGAEVRGDWLVGRICAGLTSHCFAVIIIAPSRLKSGDFQLFRTCCQTGRRPRPREYLPRRPATVP